MIKKIGLYGLFVMLIVLVLTSLKLTDNAQLSVAKVAAFEASIVEPFKNLSALDEFRINHSEEEYIFKSDGEKLVNAELPMIEEAPLWEFIGQVVSLRALTIEKVPEHTSLEKLTTYSFLQDEHYEITLELYAMAQAESYIGIVTERIGEKEVEEVLEFPQLPLAVSEFSLLYLETPLDLGLGHLKEISYQDDANSFRLSQESDLTRVETSPFISGWFLQDAYQTEFSVEYQQIEAFLARLGSLHKGGLLGFELVDNQAANLNLKLIDDAQQTASLAFYPQAKDAEETVVMHWLEQDEWYMIPQGIFKELKIEPQSFIDNFIALIPLDAIEFVSLEGLLNMRIEHSVEEIVEGETTRTQHEFTLDSHPVEETAFRKIYQYLAALAYQDLLVEPYTLSEEAALTLTYQFLSEGETITQVIHFYDLDAERFAVEKNGVLEFTANKAQITEMIAQLKDFN